MTDRTSVIERIYLLGRCDQRIEKGERQDDACRTPVCAMSIGEVRYLVGTREIQ